MRILRAQQVADITGLSRTTIWRLEREGEFPDRIHLSGNAVGWPEAEVLEWLNARPRGTRPYADEEDYENSEEDDDDTDEEEDDEEVDGEEEEDAVDEEDDED